MATMKTWRVLDLKGVATTVEAHQLTIEPSGALSFWAVTTDNMQSFLLFAFAPSCWMRVEICESRRREPVVAPTAVEDASSPRGG